MFVGSVRWGGLAAMLGGALGVVLAPLTTIAAWGGSAPMWWARAIKPVVRPMFFSGSEDVYAAYGRSFFIVYLLLLIGLLGLHARTSGATGRSGELGFQMSRAGLVMNLVGNVNDYWLGQEVLGFAIWDNSFWIFTMLGSAVYMIGSVLLGAALLRSGLLPRWASLMLLIAPPAGVLLVFWGMYHLPSSFVFPFGLGWLLVGYGLWSSNDGNSY